MDNHNEDNKMEIQIKHMLETVLKDENDEDTIHDEMSTLNLDDDMTTLNNRTNKKSITAPKPKTMCPLNFEPCSGGNIQRSQRKFHTININHNKNIDSSFIFQSSILANTDFKSNISYCTKNVNILQKNEFLQNIPETESSNYNPKLNMLINPLLNSYHFKSNFNTYENYLRSPSSIILGSSKNELEDIIEGILNKYDFINEDIYSRIQGKIYCLLKNQIGSRLLQKCLNNTPTNIRSKVLYEVIFYLLRLSIIFPN